MKLVRNSGFTLVELLVGMAASTLVGVGTFYLLNSAMLLTSKNFSYNITGNSLHRSIDRIEQYLQQANSNPTLIDDQGNAVGSGSAAGVVFDYFVGTPYVVTSGSSGLPSSTSSLTLTISTDPLASPPIPEAGDVVLIDGAAASLRPVVGSGVSAGSVTAGRKPITVPLTAVLGTAVTSTNVSSGITARVVRPAAIVVKQNGTGWELRLVKHYQSASDLSDATKYIVLSRQIGSQSADQVPFSITQINSKNFVNCSLRLRADSYDKVLANKQADGVATFVQADLSIRPKTNP